MIGLLQRVTEAAVSVDGGEIARIGPGLMVLVAVERGDDEAAAERLLDRLLKYRVFDDAEGRMNLSVSDAGGALLLVPQFTLAADTAKGLRPGFSRAAPPAEGERLFGHLARRARARFPATQTGRFGAHMRVFLVNDGPVTFWLRVSGPGEGGAGIGVSS
ncbi:MAG: D-tyrosyl-tRNA(Tyr) deacylase [Steroidobacteraceae bacterium]|nr:D-tyrosyl-tRNA(Tyr) deacylase [Steroidobacteraceae bacterium]